MKPPKFILVKIGCLADGQGTAAYQVFERVGNGDPVYHPVETVQNDPARLIVAARRMAMLESEIQA